MKAVVSSARPTSAAVSGNGLRAISYTVCRFSSLTWRSMKAFIGADPRSMAWSTVSDPSRKGCSAPSFTVVRVGPMVKTVRNRARLTRTGLGGVSGMPKA